ncbi:hypothetical protein SCP_0202980 [Sparassis crispa]|uniref:Uncharacterized protein n=1 Tax=Sparassis crispa TaxID=139825 RepID=A0A401GAB9_9APHY|nr:hypothetical protein SCP_0202980 [Sparassis crispa]GBE79101.1 hypothetical protein SCP_0202980 [Sparassis crispa]
MDNRINVKTRAFKCYCIPVMAYYENDRTVPDNHLCRPDLPAGCPHCAVIKSSICCEICSPDSPHFKVVPYNSEKPAELMSTHASHIPREYVMVPTDIKFWKALNKY